MGKTRKRNYGNGITEAESRERKKVKRGKKGKTWKKRVKRGKKGKTRKKVPPVHLSQGAYVNLS